MIFKAKKEDLLKAVESAIKGVSARSTLPILQSFLLEAQDNTLFVKSTNLDAGIEVKIKAEVEEKGSICIEAKLFYEMVKKAPGEDIFIEVDDNFNVSIRSLFSEFTIKGVSSAEYPSIPKVEEGYKIKIKQELLKKIIEKVGFSAAKEFSRPILTGILFEIKDNSITAVTSDGYRITTVTEDANEQIGEKSFVIPAKDLVEVAKILKEGDLTITIQEKHVMFSFDNTTIILRLLEGQFIQYKNFINLEGKEIKIKREKILTSLERMMLFSDEKTNFVVIRINKGELILTSKSIKGKAKEKIEVETELDGVRIGLNTKLLYEALKATESEEITLKYAGEIQPFYIIDKNYINLTLPIRLVGEEEEAA